jgi:phospho-N-acetylmuramoyl-pentapeptide-transferase
MLNLWLCPLADQFIFFNLFKYISFRTFGGLITGLVLYFIFGAWQIRQLQRLQVGQSIREEGPRHHQVKSGTPTMGGVLLLFCIMTSTILWMDLSNMSVWIVLFVYVAFAVIGFVDDWAKVKGGTNQGIKGRTKFLAQIVVAGSVAVFLYETMGQETYLSFPFFKSVQPDLGGWYILFAVLVIVGASNAVNLTDGLDGLATGPSILAFVSFAVLAYIVGHFKIAAYLQIPYLPGSGELAIFGGVVVGSLLGFLWFNTYPAEIFMGDVGSLPLGAALGTLAVLTKNEILLVLIGGVFVLEAVSVITQVISFQLLGRRIFQMAPIHHHFELKGWKEPKVIVRFWIISIILCLVALSTLKLR